VTYNRRAKCRAPSSRSGHRRTARQSLPELEDCQSRIAMCPTSKKWLRERRRADRSSAGSHCRITLPLTSIVANGYHKLWSSKVNVARPFSTAVSADSVSHVCCEPHMSNVHYHEAQKSSFLVPIPGIPNESPRYGESAWLRRIVLPEQVK